MIRYYRMPSRGMKKFTPKRLVNYLFLALVSYLAYKVLLKNDSSERSGERSLDHHGRSDVRSEHREANVYDEGSDHDSNLLNMEKALEEKRKLTEQSESLKQIEQQLLKEKENLQREIEAKRKEKERLEAILQEDKRLASRAGDDNVNLGKDVPADSKRTEAAKKHDGPEPSAKPQEKKQDEAAIEAEKARRRKEFFARIQKNKAEFNESMEMDFHERDSLLNFITAVGPDTFNAGLQLIYTVQKFYPKQGIGIFDLGLTKEQRKYLQGICSVTLHELWLKIWPEHVQNLTHSLWRPILLQLALAEMGHFIYIEPNLILKSSNIKPYIDHSRHMGIVLVGKRKKFSSFVVTHPEMLYYLSADERKLQKLPHVEITMMLMHTTETLRQRFMNLLMACTMEEWCIAPVGSKYNCDHRLFAGSKRWADCHRYDESAINVLLKHWSHYEEDKYFERDVITTHYDGTDVRDQLKMCSSGKVDL